MVRTFGNCYLLLTDVTLAIRMANSQDAAFQRTSSELILLFRWKQANFEFLFKLIILLAALNRHLFLNLDRRQSPQDAKL